MRTVPRQTGRLIVAISALAARLAGRFGIGRRIAGEGTWVAGGQIVSAIAALVSIRIMTELLTPEEFGRLALLAGVAALALGLSATPRLQALLRYYADWARAGRGDVLRRTGMRLIGRLVAVAACVIVAGWIVAGPAFGEIWFTGFLVAALLVVDSLCSFEVSLFNAARRQRVVALVQASDASTRPLMAIAAVMIFGASAEAALAGYLTGSALVVLVMRLTTRLEGTGLTEPDRSLAAGRASETDLAAAIRRYALPLAPLAIFGWLSGMGDRYVIGGMLGLEQAGLYAAAYGIASRPFLMLAGIVELTMRPVLYNAISSGDAVVTARTKHFWILLAGTGATLGVLGFLLLSVPVGGLLLAADYRSATSLMPWIAFGYALYVTSNVFSRFCYAFDDTRAVLILTIAGSVVGISVLVPAIIFFGLFGAAAAVPLRFGIELGLSAILARRAERNFQERQI